MSVRISDVFWCQKSVNPEALQILLTQVL